MKQIVCEMCGASDLVKKDGIFVCQYCNAKYSVEEAKKLMVTIDNSAKLENALKNARRAMKEGDWEQADKYKSNSYNYYEEKSTCAETLLPFPKLLNFFGNKLVSEFGKNDFTYLINVQCHETALKIVKDLYNGTRFSDYCYTALGILKEYTNELGKLRNLSHPDIHPDIHSDLRKETINTIGIVDKMIKHLPLSSKECPFSR